MHSLTQRPHADTRTRASSRAANRARGLLATSGLVLVAALGAACDPPAPVNDANYGDATLDRGLPVFDDGVVRDAQPDVPTDAGGAAPNMVSARALYKPCRTAADCNPEGGNVTLFCDQDYPEGMCRRAACVDHAECGVSGRCGLTFGCVPRCDLPGSIDPCGVAGSVCLSYEPPLRTEVGCFPSCYVRPPTGIPGCNAGSQCDPYSGRCVVSPSTEGRVNGEACATDDECRSLRCVRDALTAGLGSGFLGGYCVSTGRQVSPEAYLAAQGAGSALPQSNCPDGSAVFPDGEPAGAPTPCVRTCVTDTECRAGYRCDHAEGALGAGSRLFNRGACRPVDCRTNEALCPAGTRCTTGMPEGTSTVVGRCTARPEASDGGVTDAMSDAAGDATSSDATGDAIPSGDAGAPAADSG